MEFNYKLRDSRRRPDHFVMVLGQLNPNYFLTCACLAFKSHLIRFIDNIAIFSCVFLKPVHFILGLICANVRIKLADVFAWANKFVQDRDDLKPLMPTS